MAKKNLYRGLSFINYKNNKTLSLKDIDLVKQDILNHIYTRLGERYMMPDFGTTIMDMPFEQLDEITLISIQQDLIDVILYDPRVEFVVDDAGILTGVNIEPLYDDNAIIATATVNYIELDLTDTLEIRLEFDA